MLTSDELRAIRARYEATTPGPWDAIVNGNTVKSHAIRGVCSGISPKTGNAEFIANAHQDVPALLDTIAALTANAALGQVVREMTTSQQVSRFIEIDGTTYTLALYPQAYHDDVDAFYLGKEEDA